jgi:hypothetical protein
MSTANPLLDKLAQNLQDTIAEALVTSITDLVRGAGEDIQRYGVAMARHAVIAVARGDLALQREIKHQALLLLESNRLKLAQKHQALFLKIVDAILTYAVRAAGIAALTLIP